METAIEAKNRMNRKVDLKDILRIFVAPCFKLVTNF